MALHQHVLGVTAATDACDDVAVYEKPFILFGSVYVAVYAVIYICI